MTWTNLTILIALGIIHSASLWLVTLGAKKLGAPSVLLEWLPIALGLPTAYLAFPLALRIVMGVQLIGPEERLLGASLGLPAAVGAEAMYVAIKTIGPRIAEALLARIHGED